MARRKLVGIVAAVVLAVIGTFLLVQYVQTARDEAVAKEELVDVVVIAQLVPRGTPAAEVRNRSRIDQVPARLLADRALTSVAQFDALTGRVTNADLVPGEQVVVNRFVTPQEADAIPGAEGLLQVTITVTPEQAFGGRLRVGDAVAVLALFDTLPTSGEVPDGRGTALLLHKVPVTGVQFTPGTAGVPANDATGRTTRITPTGSFLVTLAVDVPSAERLVFAAEYGQIWLAVEPVDAPEEGSQTRSITNIF